jgi:enamine deaminase RidA (YjgF/YER057c/UK114 family)
MERTNLATGSPWEEIVGYSRAVKIGNVIEVSGTVAGDTSGEVIGENDVYLQTKFILLRIQNAIEQLGGTIDKVVRTRIYTTDISKWELIGKAHGEVFGTIKPCTSMIEISRLIDEKYLVEIEATAVLN